MKKLIRQLKFAHAAEIAAYHAYEGHWRSVSNKNEQEYLHQIELDELEHIHILEEMLSTFEEESNWILDTIAEYVGEIIGFACYYSGWRLPMLVAGFMEKIGTSSYEKIAKEADRVGQIDMAKELRVMARVEFEHEQYFKKLRSVK